MEPQWGVWSKGPLKKFVLGRNWSELKSWKNVQDWGAHERLHSSFSSLCWERAKWEDCWWVILAAYLRFLWLEQTLSVPWGGWFSSSQCWQPEAAGRHPFYCYFVLGTRQRGLWKQEHKDSSSMGSGIRLYICNQVPARIYSPSLWEPTLPSMLCPCFSSAQNSIPFSSCGKLSWYWKRVPSPPWRLLTPECHLPCTPGF